ncbi:MAG: hypothetical protein AB7K24_19335 [Gemmataceae bacterium]
MRARIAGFGGLVFLFAGLLALRGQEALRPTGAAPLEYRNPPVTTTTLVPQRPAGKDPAKLSPLTKQMYLSAQRGADWLYRMNGNDGRFVYGYVPALNQVLEGDHYLRQAGAALALARAARLTGEQRYAARATQAILRLLSDTAVDERRPGVRTTTYPAMVVNPLAASGMLVLAIHELPAPAADLLEQGEQLCQYIRLQQQPDGSLAYGDGDQDGINYYPGEALYGLMVSQRHRPATWKTEVVRKALGYYRPWFHKNKNLAFVSWQSAAYAEAYLQTGEPGFAQFVFEMNDWLRELQYPLLDPTRPLWGGGFMGWHEGKVVGAAPQISSASYAESLAEACRVARKAGDVRRYDSYRESLESCLQFLIRLQYTEANTQHFADWYRPTLVGGFHASQQDGNLRVDYTQHAICAMLQYTSFAE